MDTKHEHVDELLTERMALMVGKEWTKDLDDWRFANRIASRAEAVRQLVVAGLEAKTAASTGEGLPNTAPAEASSNQETVGDNQNA